MIGDFLDYEQYQPAKKVLVVELHLMQASSSKQQHIFFLSDMSPPEVEFLINCFNIFQDYEISLFGMCWAAAARISRQIQSS